MPREIDFEGVGQSNVFYDPLNPKLAISLETGLTTNSILVVRTKEGSQLGYDVTGDLVSSSSDLLKPKVNRIIIQADLEDKGSFKLTTVQ